jgi:hypothetical protein
VIGEEDRILSLKFPQAGGISMKTLANSILLLVTVALIGSADFATAQSKTPPMPMPANTLLVAQLNAKEVVGGSSSRATGTGAFLLNPVQHSLAYSLTYEGLQGGGAKRIVLANFGKGKNGEVVKVLCGSGAEPCPSGNSATISGRFERAGERALDNHLIGEFDSQRIYVEIIGGNGEGEIRGQLAPNGAMVPVANYVAHLQPAPGVDSKGTGTAIVSEIYFPGGKVSVFYAATVAGVSSPPVKAGLVAGRPAKAPLFNPRTALPKGKLLSSPEDVTGGSLEGLFDVDSADPQAVFVKRLLPRGNGQIGIVITTRRFPQGELFGVLVPVR